MIIDEREQQMKRFEGKTVFITGAARGQGRSHAIGFAREGADVVAVDIAAQIDGLAYPLATPAELEETAEAVRGVGGRCLAIRADVRDRAAMEEATEQAVAEFGGIDVLVANAGLFTFGSLVDIDHAAWDVTVGTILHGTWNTLKPVVPRVVERGPGGRIIITASGSVRWPQQNITPYLAAKYGLIGIMKGLSQELGKHGVTVNAVHPGVVPTPMVMNDACYRLFMPDNPSPTREDMEQVLTRMSPNGEPYTLPQDITDGVLFLASREARKISGMALDVSNGTNAYQAG